jgi:hypothetical protein
VDAIRGIKDVDENGEAIEAWSVNAASKLLWMKCALGLRCLRIHCG